MVSIDRTGGGAQIVRFREIDTIGQNRHEKQFCPMKKSFFASVFLLLFFDHVFSLVHHISGFLDVFDRSC